MTEDRIEMLRSLDWTIYANSLRTWLLALLAVAVVYAGVTLLKYLLLRSLGRLSGRTESEIDDVLAEVIRATRGWFVVVVALFAGSLLLVVPVRVAEIVRQATVFTLLLQIGVWGGVAIRTYVERYAARRLAHDAASVTTVRAVGFLATMALGAVLVLMALANLGINITALVAGLGIGGIAIALALQNILGDLFASLSIVLDKPFVENDFIVVGEMKGTVENVGLKTTRLRSLSGEQLVISNSDLLSSRIRNFKRMSERRVALSVGVVYQTSADDLARIPQLLRGAVEAQTDVRFDRAHLQELGASSLNFEVIYFVLSPDHTLFMDRHQAILLEIFRTFEREGLEFAYPTQTVHLAREGSEVEPAPPVAATV